MRLRFSVVYLFVLLFVMLSSGASEVALRFSGSDDGVIVPVLDEKNGIRFVALTVLGENRGFTLQWDKYAGRLTCSKNGTRIVFNQDKSFYSVNGTVYQLSCPVRRIGATLYLPLTVALQEVRSFARGSVVRDTIQKLPAKTAESSSRFTVASVAIEKKQNGTLLTLLLSDSLPFDCTYFYPNLTINFLGGTVDTTVIRQLTRIGLVDSMFALQYTQSAQVSIILNREIEEPLVDYIQDSRTLLVALRQKKIKPQVQTSKKAETASVASSSVSLSSTGDNMLKTIVLDPGHGGKDPGAIGVSGVMEKDVVLAIALKVRDLLKKQSKLKVLFTRDRDIFIPLSDRTKFANDKKADFFISIHADAVPGNNKRKETTRGYKIYFLSQAKNEEDKLVAMRENAVIELEEKPQNYSNLQNVLIDIAGNEFLKESQELGILLDQKFESSLKNKITKLHLGVGQANFWVLNGAYMPSVLVETGFLSNATEEKLLDDKVFQAKIAQSVVDAIIGFSDKYGSGI